jgi:hypothetical protein
VYLVLNLESAVCPVIRHNTIVLAALRPASLMMIVVLEASAVKGLLTELLRRIVIVRL